MSEKLAVAIVALCIGAAYLTKPSKDDFEKYVSNNVANSLDQKLEKGDVFGWLFGKGVDVVRSGRYEPGVLSSSYYVTIAGNPVAKCTGLFAYVWCDKVK